MDLRGKKILLTGGNGFLGRHVLAKLLERGVPREAVFIPDISEYDLREKAICLELTKDKDLVIHLAALVGGIKFNKENPGRMFYDNAVMAVNMVDAAYRNGVKKFIGIGSACEYPKNAPVPFREEDIWSGYPEETNGPYGLSKRVLLAHSQAYNAQYGFNAIHLIPTNMYGPGDNFNPETAHVIPSTIRKIAEAQKDSRNYIEAWGTGKATREFLYVEDAAEGIVAAAENYDKPEPVNLATGREIAVKDLVETIARLMDFNGEIRWDASKPDGQPRRSLDTSRAEREFGFRAKTPLEEGLKKTLEWWQNLGINEHQ